MRAHLVGAMIAVTVTGIAVTGFFVTRAVDAELAASSRRDLRLAALSTAETAAAVYIEAGGWTQRSVHALHTVARARGDAIVVLGAGARPVPGSPAVAPARGGVRAAVVVRGRRVGTVVATHRDRFGIVDSQLTERINRLLVQAALIAGWLALLVALGVGLRMARPLKRLTDVAGRLEAGELDSAAIGAGGSREMIMLARTMDRLAAALRRQDEVRRATAADVSHELRGALVGVFTRIDALQDGLVDDERTMFAQLERDARRLRRLVYDVHLLTEAQRPALFIDKCPIALDDLVRDRVAGHTEPFRARSISLDARPRAGARGRGSRAARPGARQPAVERAALHGSRRSSGRESRRAGRRGSARRRRLRRWHRARASRASLRPLLARPGRTRPRCRGIGRGPGARVRAGPRPWWGCRGLEPSRSGHIVLGAASPRRRTHRRGAVDQRACARIRRPRAPAIARRRGVAQPGEAARRARRGHPRGRDAALDLSDVASVDADPAVGAAAH